MASLASYIRQHHLALLALVLILVGGTAYAATLPKNSVRSSTVKNNSLTGKDIKDKRLTGADLRDRSVAGVDLAADVRADFDIKRLSVPTNTTAVLLSDPTYGTVSVTCGPSNAFSVIATLPATATPGTVAISGSDLTDNLPVGASALTQPNAGQSGGQVTAGGAANVVPRISIQYDTATRDVDVLIHSFVGGTCAVRASVTSSVKSPGELPTSRAGSSAAATCRTVGSALCTTA